MKKNIPLLLIFLTLALLIFFNIQVVVDFAGRYIYPLDDAYIHLSMAKNFAEFQTWGITQYEFSSTTSSPLFTFLLAILIKVFGNWEYIPLVANSLAGVALILVFHQYLKQFSKATYIIFLSSLVLLMPLHLMIMTGMEHVFHALTMVLVLLAFKKYLDNEAPRNFSNLALLAILATGFRYESLFFIFFMCVYLFFIKREYFQSIALGLFAITPVLIYGWISVDHGSFFLPNSLILKGNTNDGIVGFLTRVAGNGYRGISVLLLILILLIQIFIKSKSQNSFIDKIKVNPIPMVVFCGFAVHLLFANFGWLIRYEAYLVVVILLAIAPFADELFQKKKGNQVLKFSMVILLLITFSLRFVPMLKNQPKASKNIFDQQIQLADFLHQYYKNSKVVANDIGAITYFNYIHLLDTYGLGSIEVAKLRKEDHGKFADNKKLQAYIYNTAKLQDFEVALVFDEWVKMPDYFSKVGTLTIQDNYMAGGTTVSFYAVKKENTNKLRNQLVEFSKQTPKDVIINIKK
ncbi:EpsG family protein [Epilithonimonas xixisoli]|uniref:4-amino-4-deoxy-L-arabinose transferase-like glycosyltransferase n=1 Tax=Epilithonimonas xixisoli TaxID=1476462 RepID=A0A4R8I5P4_9FLAO|nr:EpsG family protein [Epilithonimonas xixisoli]TDX84243.1 4-amino-4-deoxy-L-arabinose transferase-like glycosyltransferase [Epilithonimonas xixisoli]